MRSARRRRSEGLEALEGHGNSKEVETHTREGGAGAHASKILE